MIGISNGAVPALVGSSGRSVWILLLVGQAPVVVPVHPLVVPVGAAPSTAVASHTIGAVQHVLRAEGGRENAGGL